MNDLINKRLKIAREKAGLTQAQLAEKLGFKDRQTLAAIEAGQRKMSAEELVRAMHVFGVDLDYFIDGFRLVGKGKFSWRAAKDATPKLLDEFEERAGRWIAMYRRLGKAESAPVSPLQYRLPLSERSTFEEARAVAEALGRDWDLGEIPALRLDARVRERLGALVLFVDAPLRSQKRHNKGDKARPFGSRPAPASLKLLDVRCFEGEWLALDFAVRALAWCLVDK